MAKSFAWSWSKLKNYRACPKKHYHVDLAKEYKEDEGPDTALGWGKQLHDAMASRISKGTPLPPTMARYDRFPANIVEYGKVADIKVEQKLSIARDFSPTAYFDNNTWFRIVADVLVIPKQAPVAIAVDWKTGGTIKPDMEQLGLSAQVIFSHYPEVNTVRTSFEWLGHNENTPMTYTRGGDDLVQLWNRVLPEVNAMEEAARTLTYPPRPSGLCKRHCPVASCPHHGKGSR